MTNLNKAEIVNKMRVEGAYEVVAEIAANIDANCSIRKYYEEKAHSLDTYDDLICKCVLKAEIYYQMLKTICNIPELAPFAAAAIKDMEGYDYTSSSTI